MAGRRYYGSGGAFFQPGTSLASGYPQTAYSYPTLPQTTYLPGNQPQAAYLTPSNQGQVAYAQGGGYVYATDPTPGTYGVSNPAANITGVPPAYTAYPSSSRDWTLPVYNTNTLGQKKLPRAQNTLPRTDVKPRSGGSGAPRRSRRRLWSCVVSISVIVSLCALGIALAIYFTTESNANQNSGHSCTGLVCTDYCISDPCNSKGECISGVDKPICTCDKEYTGEYCQLDYDECSYRNGGCEELCINMEGSYNCSCTSGKIPAPNHHSCIDVVDCDKKPCVMGTCVETSGGYLCLCEDGYEGEMCDQDIDECSAPQRLCEGDCENTIGGFNCSCPGGQMLGDNGLSCSDILECSSNPCQNGGACEERDGGFYCSCNNGWTGEMCEFELCDNDAGWLYYSGDSRCYKYYSRQQDLPENQGLSWNVTELKCNEEDANLFSINSDSELEFVYNKIILVANGGYSRRKKRDSEPENKMWIGLRVGGLNDTDTWYYSDGSDVNTDVLHWNSNEPSIADACVQLNTAYLNDVTGRHDVLESVTCDPDEHSYICEKPANDDGSI